MITVALLHKFVYELRGNNTYIILDRTALVSFPPAEPAEFETLICQLTIVKIKTAERRYSGSSLAEL